MASEENILQESGDVPFIPESISSHDLAISNFSQVIFPDIPDFFPPESDIIVPYILTEAIEATTRDWIGLFRVGWASPRDYSTYVWAPKPQNTSLSKARPQSVSFQAYQLPGDDKEFYQFCYVTKQGYVRGASTPFQFRHSTENDCLVEMEDETGMIILRTKSDALEEQLAAITQEKASLEETIENLTAEKVGLMKKIAAIEAELKRTQENQSSNEAKNLKLEEELKNLSQDLEESENKIKEAKEKIVINETSLGAAEKTIENLKTQIEELEEQKQHIIDTKANEDELHVTVLTAKEVKIQEFEREKVTLLDQIKTLTLVKEEAQQKSAAQQTAQEEATKASFKAKQEIATKLQCCKDERDLFKTQLKESELARQETLQQLQNLTEKLGEAENKLKAKEQELNGKIEELNGVSKALNDLEKKFHHETSISQEFLHNALERANALKTAKQLLSTELSDATAARDKLMNDLINVKKEKEEVNEMLLGKVALVGTLQNQLEDVGEKLAKSERMLLEHEKNVKAEKTRAVEVEKQMKEKVILLQHQLQEADHAVATLSNTEVTKKAKKTQTSVATKGTCDGEGASDESKAAIDDLKAQVADLTTRLNMGADAYKEKFMECHKMEKKLKKMKQLLQIKQSSAGSPVPSQSSSTSKPTSEENPQGWVGAFEKFFNAIADPDAEEKEQARQIQQKLETLQKSVEQEQGKHRRYKQLYNEEKQKIKSLKEREEEVMKALNDAEEKANVLDDENKMLKAQLREFIGRSDDVTLKQVMTFTPESTSGGSSSQEEGRDEDHHYQDAPGVPMYAPSLYRAKKSTSEQSTSSDASDEGSYGGGNGSFRKFNMCPDRNEESAVVHSFTSSKKEKVVSHQPIRSPPHIPDIITWSNEAGTSRSGVTSSDGDARKRKTQSRRKQRKK